MERVVLPCFVFLKNDATRFPRRRLEFDVVFSYFVAVDEDVHGAITCLHAGVARRHGHVERHSKV